MAFVVIFLANVLTVELKLCMLSSAFSKHIFLKFSVTEPDKPKNVNLKFTSRTITLSWEEPNNENGPIDGYFVSFCQTGTDCENGTYISHTYSATQISQGMI